MWSMNDIGDVKYPDLYSIGIIAIPLFYILSLWIHMLDNVPLK